MTRHKCYQCGNWVLEKHIHKERLQLIDSESATDIELCTMCWLIMKRNDEVLEDKETEVEVQNETEKSLRTRSSKSQR
jgi:hypothetical protein